VQQRWSNCSGKPLEPFATNHGMETFMGPSYRDISKNVKGLGNPQPSSVVFFCSFSPLFRVKNGEKCNFIYKITGEGSTTVRPTAQAEYTV
jgi:hypothetical protein